MIEQELIMPIEIEKKKIMPGNSEKKELLNSLIHTTITYYIIVSDAGVKDYSSVLFAGESPRK